MSEKETDQRPAAADKKPPARKKGSGGGKGSVLAILLLLVAICVASYPAYEFYRQKIFGLDGPGYATASDLERLRRQYADGQAALAKVSAAIEALRGEQARAIEEFTEANRLAGDEMAEIKKSLGISGRDWLYAEVEYLVRMANQRVLMERDPSSALELLTAADKIVREAEGLTAHDLRQAIAEDVATLRAVGDIDVQGIYLELAALVKQVPDLKGSNLKEKTTGLAAQAQDAVEAGDDDAPAPTFADGIVDRITSLVDFRRGSIEVRPLLPPREEYYLRQNLALKLQTAQIALLSADQAVYETAVREAADWVDAGFDRDDAVTISFRESLVRLSSVTIAAALPDISASLEQARLLLRNFDEADAVSP